MPFLSAVTRSLAVSIWAILLVSPCAAIDRLRLQAFFDAPYSVGERDGGLPIWPIFKTTSSGDELLAYVFEFTDFEPAPDSRNSGIDRLVAVRPSGEFLEVQILGAEHPPLLNWFGRKPVFDFIARDQGGSLTQNALERSRDYVRARLAIAAEPPKAVWTVRGLSASTAVVLTALAVSIALLLAALFGWRARFRSPAKAEGHGERGTMGQGERGAIRHPSLEFDT
jgi:transcriptional regulator of nitric oxide reductase